MALKLSRVLISDSVDASCREILESSGIPVDYKPGVSKDDLLAIIKVKISYISSSTSVVAITGFRLQ